MRKLDLTEYEFEKVLPTGEVVKDFYKVKESLLILLYARQQGLNAVELLKRDDLARKIHDHAGAAILLEDAEFAQIDKALDSMSGLGREDVGFVRRIKEAPQVDSRSLTAVK